MDKLKKKIEENKKEIEHLFLEGKRLSSLELPLDILHFNIKRLTKKNKRIINQLIK